MRPEFFSGSAALEAVWALGILLISVLVAWLFLLSTQRVQRKLAGQRGATLLAQLWQRLSKVVFLLIVAEGLLLAIGSLSYLEAWRGNLATIGVTIVIALVTYASGNSAGLMLTWYLRSQTVRRRVAVDEGLIRFVRRIVLIAIYVLGVLVVLDYLKIAITPILAGLGIGGLAVALALQPTLGNFFASTQIISDRVVRIGDYIELGDGSIRGYVTDIGWRSTRIRTPYNNLVIVPNSRLAESTITNYSAPTMEMALIVNSGVSYSSDLAQVERIGLEVAREMIGELDEADKTFEPWFGYEEFGESNINFWIWLQAKDRISSFRLKSELIKRLKARFDREGITINYPVRRVFFERTDSSPRDSSGDVASSDTAEDRG